MILFLSFYISYIIRKNSRERIQILEELCLLCEYIENQIEYYCTPTEEILSSYHSVYLEERGFLPIRGDECWRDKLAGCGLAEYLDASVLGQISTFSDKLGRSCSEDQIANCRHITELLSRRLDKDRSDIPRRARAYSALCLVSAFMTVILII